MDARRPAFRAFTAFVSCVVAAALAGCATPPPPKVARTTVVLMPDEDGRVGAVSVSTETGTRRIDRAYHFATVDGVHGRPSDMTAMGEESATRTYDRLIGAQPPKPKTFVLHFLLDKDVLTDESRAMIPLVLEAIRERKPTEITIFGHADAVGPEQHNLQLSADRAHAIAALMRRTDPTLDRIDVQYFGDKVPLVPTDAGKPQPRNRRVEIQVL